MSTPPVTIYSLTTCGWSRKAKEYFKLWEAEHEADEAGGFEEILNKVRDYSRKKKLDSSVSRSKDDMDLGRVGEDWSEEDYWEEVEKRKIA